MKLNIYGSIFGNDGYSSHTRSLFKGLHNQKELDIKLNTSLPQNWINQCSDAELDSITKQDRKQDWNLIITIPHMWKLFLGAGKNACYCVWEGDKIPFSWIDEMLNPKVDLIIVPSKHTEQAIWNTMGEINSDLHPGDNHINSQKLYEKIRVVPHGVDKKVFYNQRKKDKDETQYVPCLETRSKAEEDDNIECKTVRGIPLNLAGNHADIFRFISNKGWRGTSWDRGGVQYLLKAYAEEFNKDEKVELIIKLNSAYINPAIIEQSVNNLNLPDDRAKIHITSEFMSPKKLNELYNSADCFICATRAESFNLPGIEAMSCGLPTIQTSFGGQTDYMTKDNSLYINYILNPSEEVPMYEGINWATPKIESIKKQLRWAFENQDKIKEMGNQSEIDSNQWTWDLSAQKLVKNLTESDSNKEKIDY